MTQAQDEAIKRLYSDVGSRVRAAREDRGVTQLTLSEKIGLTRSSVANLERGHQRIPLHILALIAEVLDVALFDLMPERLSRVDDVEMFPNVKDELARVPESADTARRFVEGAMRQLGADREAEVK